MVVPEPDVVKVPMAYAIGQRDQALAAFVNTWIELKRKDGTLDALQVRILRPGRCSQGAALVHHAQRARLDPLRWSSRGDWIAEWRLLTRNHRSRLDRFLGVFTDVHAGEGFTALLLALNVFLILMAYYILKPVREALILGEGSAELKTYMSAGQVVVLAFVVPMYAKLVANRPRMRLINTVTAFFTACLVVFYLLAQAGVPLAIRISSGLASSA